MMKKLIIASALLVASAGMVCAQDAAKGEKVFKKCRACHAVGPDAKNKVGPILNGLDGRKSGSVAGYNYSDANKNSGITWNEAEFLDYIKNPRDKIKGTKMIFPGIKSVNQAKDLWAYLSQFEADGSKKYIFGASFRGACAAREPGIQPRAQDLHLDSGLRFQRVRNDQLNIVIPAS